MQIPDWNIFPCGVYAISRDNRITVWNEALTRLTGFDADRMIGQKASQIQFHETEKKENLVNPYLCVKTDISPFLSRTLYVKDAEHKLKLAFIQAKLIDRPDLPDVYILVTVSDISEEISCELLESSREEKAPARFHGIVGKTKKMRDIYRLIELASESLVNVLITGESGTGKELVARAIHYTSGRKSRPFVTVNCSALTETLLESELFGHVRGAFTGAYRDKIGKFESANGGTIFLDEIGDISPLIQLKLLRVIQEKTIERVGDNRQMSVDMRIITATNKHLRQMVAEGLFREDLYYRLKVFPIHMIPLRDRKGDIPLLCRSFIEQFKRKTGKDIRGLTENASRLLMGYCWPGNVRELENTIEYAFVMCDSNLIDVFDLPQDIRVIPLRDEACGNREGLHTETKQAAHPSSGDRPRHTRHKISRDELVRLLEQNEWNKAETARQLDISRVALWKKLKSLGIESR